MDRSTLVTPTDRAIHIANQFTIISSILLVTATLLFIARIWTRCFPIYRMLADDYVCAIAYVLVVINTSLFFKGIEWAFPTWKGDRSKLTLGDMEKSAFHGITAQPFWAWGMAAIKISIGLMLLRFESETRWRRFLWSMIAFQIVLSMYSMLAQFFGCVPFRKTWDLSQHVDGYCWPNHINTASQVTVQVFVILTDWIFALLPISFLRKVQRPLRERVIIGMLMGLGVFTGVASIVKIKQLLTMQSSKDLFAEILVIEMWCSIEALIGFIASCVPCLRGPFQRALEHFGIVTIRSTTTYTYGAHPGTRYATQITSGTLSVNEPPIRMKRAGSPGGESVERIISGNEATVKNGEIWCTTEVQLEEEQGLRTPSSVYVKAPGMTWGGLTTSRRLSQG